MVNNILPVGRLPKTFSEPGGHDGRYHNHYVLPLRRVPEGSRPPRRPASPSVHCRGDERSPLLAAAFFGGNVEASRSFLDEYGYIEKAISKSRFNRRLHAIDSSLWLQLFDLLAEVFKQNNPDQSYVVDSLPVAVCDNIRIRRSKLYPLQEHGAAFRGYIASKRRYFYGLRVHLVSTASGEPVEFTLAAASEADIRLFKELKLELPEGAIICADKGYTDYHYEDLLEDVGLHLKARRCPCCRNIRFKLPPIGELRPCAGWARDARFERGTIPPGPSSANLETDRPHEVAVLHLESQIVQRRAVDPDPWKLEAVIRIQPGVHGIAACQPELAAASQDSGIIVSQWVGDRVTLALAYP